MCYLRSSGHHAVSHLVYSGLTYHEPHPGLVTSGQSHGGAEERRAVVTGDRGLARDHKIQTWARYYPVIAPCHAGTISCLGSMFKLFDFCRIQYKY